MWRAALLLGLSGCWLVHEHERAPRAEGIDAGVAPDAPPAADAGPPDEACAFLEAMLPVEVTTSPPSDFTVGQVARSPDGDVTLAFTSSNDPIEMDVSRWLRQIDPTTGERRRERRTQAFGEPRGAAYASLARVVYGPGEGITFTYSYDEGCVVRRLGRDGELTSEVVRLGPHACLSARATADGYVFFSRDRDDRDLASFTWVDRGLRVMRSSEPSRALGASRDYSWQVARDGALWLAQVTEGSLRFGRWDVARAALTDARELASEASDVRLRLREDGAPLLGWLEDGRIVLFRPDVDPEPFPTGIGALSRAGWDLAEREGEVWVVFANAPEDHAAARVFLARFDERLALREAPRVGDYAFPGRVRLVITNEGALVVAQGQRADDSGATAIFAAPVRCSRAPSGRDCAPWDARNDPCLAGECEPDGYLWTNAGCTITDCSCVGPDCARRYRTLEACEAAHRDCDATLCQDTGGTWIAQNGFYCEHTTCGHDLADCDAPAPSVCHCGFDRSWRGGVGCVRDFMCDREADRPTRCTASGGVWGGAMCCPTECGLACGDDCTSPDCACPPTMVWTEEAGCVPAARCVPRDACD